MEHPQKKPRGDGCTLHLTIAAPLRKQCEQMILPELGYTEAEASLQQSSSRNVGVEAVPESGQFSLLDVVGDGVLFLIGTINRF